MMLFAPILFHATRHEWFACYNRGVYRDCLNMDSMLRSRSFIVILLISVVVIVAILAAALVLVPTQTSPAFQTALDFVNAAVQGVDANALAKVSDPIRAYAAENCPDGSISACVDAYTPEDWGAMKTVVYRRSAPVGDEWDVDLIAHYESGTGSSGVCIYARVAPLDESGENWQVTRYAGFVHCGDPASRDMAANPDAPNTVP